MELSVIIPVRNEAKNIPVLVSRIHHALDGVHPLSEYEIIFVTDLNDDDTVDVLVKESISDAHVKAIKLSNRFGQHVAIIAGLEKASGQQAVIMDGDLQDYPEDIPLLYQKMNEGYDIVYGVKEKKNDKKIRNLYSIAFNKVMSMLSDVTIAANSSMFRILSRKAIDEVLRFKEREPSLTYIFSLINLPTSSVNVQSGIRNEGATNYSFMKLIDFAISSLVSFSRKPLRFISTLGLVVSCLSFLFVVIIFFQWAFAHITVTGWTTLVILITFLSGIQLLSLGILGEYLGRTFMETKRRPLYTVEKTIGNFQQSPADGNANE